MYKYLLSKKGFTLFEIMVVLIVLAILTAVAVPTYNFVARKLQIKDCKNQIITVQGFVDMVMVGMQDNGVKIINMNITGAASHGSGTSKYWIISTTESPTLQQMRNGQTQEEFNAAVSATDHLKKSSMATMSFASLLTEIPSCPLDSDDQADELETYGYRIYSDGTVKCNNPNCPNCPDYVE